MAAGAARVAEPRKPEATSSGWHGATTPPRSSCWRRWQPHRRVPHAAGRQCNGQEPCRKDVERSIGVLQARFAINYGHAHFWDQKDLWRIMTVCVILNNMIIEDERGQLPNYRYENEGNKVYIPAVQPQRDERRLHDFLRYVN
nr:uncharacterized protein LOC120964694 [Aegilops tauschii subsp. strangulata]